MTPDTPAVQAIRAAGLVHHERLRGRRITLGSGVHGLAVALDADAALAALSATVADISDAEARDGQG